MPKEYSLGEVARLTGVAYYRLYYAYYTAKIPEPKKIGKTRIFTDEDVEIIKEHFGRKEDKCQRCHSANTKTRN
jgi:DNA-binding transcriptional MerR regulator